MQIFNYNVFTGELIGSSSADESPLEPGVFLVPFGATTTPPQEIPAGKMAVFSDGDWAILDNSSPDRPVAEAPNETQAQTIARYEAALDAHLDSVARQHRYDNRFTFALRAGFDGPYQIEGNAFAQWMDACNKTAFDLLGEVVAGTKPMPTIEAFIESLPLFEMP